MSNLPSIKDALTKNEDASTKQELFDSIWYEFISDESIFFSDKPRTLTYLRTLDPVFKSGRIYFYFKEKRKKDAFIEQIKPELKEFIKGRIDYRSITTLLIKDEEQPKPFIKINYKQSLRHPRWQRRRLEIMNRDNFKCTKCGDEETTLHVHHLEYHNGCEPWEYDDRFLSTLCEDCHTVVEKINKDAIDNDCIIEFNEMKIMKFNKWDSGDIVLFVNYKEHSSVGDKYITLMSVYSSNKEYKDGYMFPSSKFHKMLLKFYGEKND